MDLTEQQEIIKQRLLEIQEKNGRILRAEDVVADARRKSSPLHGLPIWKNWDLKASAMSFWVEQARELIRTVQLRVTTDTTIISVPYFIRDPSAEPGKQGYVSVNKLRTEEDRAREALVMEFQKVAALLKRARDLAVVLGMADDVDRLVDSVAGVRAIVENHATQ